MEEIEKARIRLMVEETLGFRLRRRVSTWAKFEPAIGLIGGGTIEKTTMENGVAATTHRHVKV